MTAELGTQQRLLDALEAGTPLGVPGTEVERIDTHISCIFLVGDHAYKIKKALDLGFVDFTTLESRREACEAELQLNARLASQVYQRVATFSSAPEGPVLDGEGPVLEYAVVMRRFPQSALFSHMLHDQRLTTAHMDELAAVLAAFHQRVPAAPLDSGFGTPQAVARRTRENLDTLPELMPDAATDLAELERWSEVELERLTPAITRRREQGRVRECHGDLHLDNIIHWQGQVMAFDGIEFDPDLRWIDVANELAFVTMDLDDRQAEGFSRRLRDAYLERTGDYDGLTLLPFYQVYRALVRAKINALQAGQQQGREQADEKRERAAEYLALARSYTRRRQPALVLMHGVSGTGKSTLTEDLIQRRGYIRLRSDVVRKHLFGLGMDQSSHAAGIDIYTGEASRRTYEQLRAQAETALEAGYSVVLDATFLKRAHRAPFIELAKQLGVAWRIVSLNADPDLLRSRVAERERAGSDPSEAGVAVLERQFQELEPLRGDEAEHALELDAGAVPQDWDRPLPG